MSYIFKTADWKTEKHVPVIEILEKAEAKKLITVRVSVGKEIPHPNTTEHHIRWIRLLFWPEDSNFPYDLGFVEFNAHGESVKGPNTSGVYTEPIAVFSFRTEKPGKLIAFSYCNIHGLWSSETELKF
ncbi:MAG: class II SORL domain-containing protein [Crenarchaeota archaeon]|nr:class II SORL domain-containing protein [Thermoproteota archaeon]MCR8454384.1 class II SORL domain-containing protein [Thermoproteota archaeon]MCR8455493.1 class II SORL domain-containing protein [Thermoproteota archaeon]MCR8463733.1 class II SORL domain-containing protein [Thermoproteota archaeon]MCR8471359.1 class II SORL domain-containing protein [Thermoproteota archaeon]